MLLLLQLGRARRAGRLLLGLVDFSVGLGELEPDGLGQVGVKADAVQVELGRFGLVAAGECDEANWRGALAILAGHLEQGALVALVGAEEEVEFARLGVHGQAGDEERAHLLVESRDAAVGGAVCRWRVGLVLVLLALGERERTGQLLVVHCAKLAGLLVLVLAWVCWCLRAECACSSVSEGWQAVRWLASSLVGSRLADSLVGVCVCVCV